jgi:hypothetical protein
MTWISTYPRVTRHGYGYTPGMNKLTREQTRTRMAGTGNWRVQPKVPAGYPCRTLNISMQQPNVWAVQDGVYFFVLSWFKI